MMVHDMMCLYMPLQIPPLTDTVPFPGHKLLLVCVGNLGDMRLLWVFGLKIHESKTVLPCLQAAFDDLRSLTRSSRPPILGLHSWFVPVYINNVPVYINNGSDRPSTQVMILQKRWVSWKTGEHHQNSSDCTPRTCSACTQVLVICLQMGGGFSQLSSCRPHSWQVSSIVWTCGCESQATQKTTVVEDRGTTGSA